MRETLQRRPSQKGKGTRKHAPLGQTSECTYWGGPVLKRPFGGGKKSTKSRSFESPSKKKKQQGKKRTGFDAPDRERRAGPIRRGKGGGKFPISEDTASWASRRRLLETRTFLGKGRKKKRKTPTRDRHSGKKESSVF